MDEARRREVRKLISRLRKAKMDYKEIRETIEIELTRAMFEEQTGHKLKEEG